jgi:hypothetical protein
LAFSSRAWTGNRKRTTAKMDETDHRDEPVAVRVADEAD